jgi:hypothetical protein
MCFVIKAIADFQENKNVLLARKKAIVYYFSAESVDSRDGKIIGDDHFR